MLARCDAAGELIVDRGRVEIRFRATDPRAYQAAAYNLAPTANTEVLSDDTCVEAKADAPRAATGGRGGGMTKRAAAPAAGPPPANALLAYTDGACSGNPGPAGAGVVMIDGATVRELSEYLGNGTNNIAELTAIELALLAAPPDRPLRVHTDSQYAIGVLTKNWKAKANQELIAKIRLLVKAHKALEMVYVPGHSGVPLNERADVLAVQAVQTRSSTGWLEVAS